MKTKVGMNPSSIADLVQLSLPVHQFQHIIIVVKADPLLGDMPIKFIGKNFVHFSIGIKY